VRAQGRRSNQLSYAPNRIYDDFHVLPVLLALLALLLLTARITDT
jgi:hypothetical protein